MGGCATAAVGGLRLRGAFEGGGGGGGKPGGFAAAFALGSPDGESAPALLLGPGTASRERERRIGAFVELKPVLPAPHPGPLPNFSMRPGGNVCERRAFFSGFHGASLLVSSMAGRNKFDGAGVVCAHSDAPHNPASVAPIGTAKRNEE
ncbi:MAG: hypothetical protein JO328_17175 [Hyphomicrobiales bacterium]|nr:hypothetical protein [Hyphomicrobiales bacterium]